MILCRNDNGGGKRRDAILRFSGCLALNNSIVQTRAIMGRGYPMQAKLRYPTVTCPGCKRPIMPSRPLPVSEDTELCDVTYTCEDCGATTTRTIKIEK
jgi:RNase P subunit RPR2